MSPLLTALLCTASLLAATAQRERPSFAENPADLENPAIDMSGFLADAREAAAHRATRRLSEAQFLAMSIEPGTVILDARSPEKYQLLHVAGAINLSFPDITVASLAAVLPDPNVRVLIYCNNNFEHAETAFPTKRARASLNLSTYISLYTYGYRNIYELGPLLDIRRSILPFAGTGAKAALAAAE